MGSSNKNEKSEELIKSIYKLGYEVGFQSHNEFWGWVRKSKKNLFDDADSAGFYKEAQEEFQRGKIAGKLAKQKQGKDLRKTQFLKTKRPVPKHNLRDLGILERDLVLLKQIKFTFLDKPLHASRSRLIELPKLVKLPKFLRMNKSKR